MSEFDPRPTEGQNQAVGSWAVGTFFAMLASILLVGYAGVPLALAAAFYIFAVLVNGR